MRDTSDLHLDLSICRLQHNRVHACVYCERMGLLMVDRGMG